VEGDPWSKGVKEKTRRRLGGKKRRGEEMRRVRQKKEGKGTRIRGREEQKLFDWMESISTLGRAPRGRGYGGTEGAKAEGTKGDRPEMKQGGRRKEMSRVREESPFKSFLGKKELRSRAKNDKEREAKERGGPGKKERVTHSWEKIRR